MKRVSKLLLSSLLLLFAIFSFSCTQEVNPPVKETKVMVNQELITIKEKEIDTYNFKMVFSIKDNGKDVEVLDDYIDTSNLKKQEGTYFVYCNYKDKQGKIAVKVEKSIIQINLDIEETTVEINNTYKDDFKDLFSIIVDGKEIEILDEYVETNIKEVKGTYFYKVSYSGISKSLKVIVEEEKIVNITPVENITIPNEDVKTFDYKSLFKIEVNRKDVPCLDEYLDITSVSDVPNEYTIKCTYLDKVAYAKVVVVDTIYNLTLLSDEIQLSASNAKDFDYKSLFVLTRNDIIIEIKDEYVQTDVLPVKGEYTYTVSCKGNSKTLKVSITKDHTIEIIPTYKEVEITIDELNDYDYTKLFSLYVDNQFTKFENKDLDLSSLKDAKANNSYQISFTYTLTDTTEVCNITIFVKEADEVIVNTKSLEIYPNSDIIDLTTLFEITKGDEIIPVTSNMITGNIDYLNVGVNEITLSYENKTYTSTVEVKMGVVISYTKGETIQIRKGTNKDTYPFYDDFVVTINGIKFDSIPSKYIDVTNVDFSNTGEYECTITIPYNDKRFGLSGVNFTYISKTIKYNVIDSISNVKVISDVVKLKKGTNSYNVFSNLYVEINGKTQTLTTNIDYVDPITCYAKVLSENIDFNTSKMQEVVISLYVNGVNSDPIIVKYNLYIESDVVINAIDKVIYTNDTLYTKDLFTVYDGEVLVDSASYDVSGKVDSFTPGIYYININYLGIVKTSKVVVIDNRIIGEYKTNMTSISQTVEDDEYGTITTTPTKRYSLKIDNEGIYVNGIKAQILSAINEKSFEIQVNSYKYVLYYDNGIVVLDPDNSIKLGFNVEKRPLIFFNTNTWEINDKLVINYGDSYVLNETTYNYSFDVFKITSEEYSMWYALKVHLISKTSSDTIYNVSFGEIIFDKEFKFELDETSSFTFNNEKYNFKVTKDKVFKTNIQLATKSYANLIFTGQIDGIPTTLMFDQYEGISIYQDSKKILTIGSYEIKGSHYGGLDKANDIALIYSHDDNKNNPDNIYAYKFIFNYQNKTFEYVEKDLYFGKYICDDKFIFLDGYGKGLVNFNTKSYFRTNLEYTVTGNTVNIKFIDKDINFEYGDTLTLSISNFLNVLNVTSSYNNLLRGCIFENCKITEGAIVSVRTFKIGQNTDTLAKNELYQNIDIITKNGHLTNEEKKNIIYTSYIRFNTPGYYDFYIKINVSGKELINHYAIEILEEIYKDNDVAQYYGDGVINSETSLNINKYGIMAIEYKDVTYQGSVTILDDKTFFATLYNDEGKSVLVSGAQIIPGLVSVRCSGDVSFTDLYTTLTHFASGTDRITIRKFSNKTDSIYLISESSKTIGTITTIEAINEVNAFEIGSIFKTVWNGKTYVLKVNAHGDFKTGLVISDNYRGVYTKENDTDLIVDGFNKVTIGHNTYDYTLNGSIITVDMKNTMKVYKLDSVNYTYQIYELNLDNSLVASKSFSADYVFLCGYYPYNATTRFKFSDNSVVTVYSQSTSHDDGTDACTEDLYDPLFANKNGVNGTYSVVNNIITVNVKGYTFTFKILDLIKVDSIVLLSSTLPTDSHGYIDSNTHFQLK